MSYFVCAVSLTHSLRLCKPHLARYKYIISRHLHWMQLKLESFSGETRCLQSLFTRDCECVCGCDVIACAAGNKRIGSKSARRETDRPVTDPGRSCEKLADSDHWPVNRCISNKKPSNFFTVAVLEKRYKSVTNLPLAKCKQLRVSSPKN